MKTWYSPGRSSWLWPWLLNMDVAIFSCYKFVARRPFCNLLLASLILSKPGLKRITVLSLIFVRSYACLGIIVLNGYLHKRSARVIFADFQRNLRAGCIQWIGLKKRKKFYFFLQEETGSSIQVRDGVTYKTFWLSKVVQRILENSNCTNSD